MTTTTAPLRIVVDALGEIYRQVDGKGSDGHYGDDTISLRHVAENYLSKEQLEIWLAHEGPKAAALDRHVQEMARTHMFHELFKTAPLPVYDFVSRTYRLQGLNDSRCRVWGEKLGEGFDSEEHIWLVTELRQYTDTDSTERWWIQVEEAAQPLYEVVTIDSGREMEQSWGAEQSRPFTDENAHYGPNHGRPYRQVEFRRDIVEISGHRNSLDHLREEIRKLTCCTERFWRDAGVNVV